MTSAIAMRDVALKMGDARLLHEVNLDLQAGETGVVIGETGSGKSSLLRLVLGLPGIQREDQVRIRGEVLVEGVSVFELSSGELQDLRRKIGLVKGDGGLIENMDVRRNVALPLAYHASAMRGDQIESRCEAVLADLGIADLGRSGKRPVALNQEERAYVSLARARIVEPTILLADDPTLGLGVGASERLVGHLCGGGQMTRLITTSWLPPYIDRADRFYLLEDGRILPLGGVAELGACEYPWVRDELAGSRLE